MKALSSSSYPRLAVGCRVRKIENGDTLLLLPEGLLRLKGTGAEIVELCDGAHTFAEIVGALQAQYRSCDPQQIEWEAESFLNRLQERRAIDFQ